MKKAVLLLFLAFVSVNLQSQNLGQTFQAAKYRLLEGNEKEAMLRFRRVAYFTNEFDRAEVWYQAALIADSLSASSFAIAVCDSALRIQSTESEQAVIIRLIKIKHLLLKNQNSEAAFCLNDSVLHQDTAFQFDETILRIILSVQKDDFLKTKLLLSEMNMDSIPALEEMQRKCRNRKAKLRTAEHMSSILPGSGLIFLGYPKEGFRSLIVNAVLFYILYELSVNYSWYTGMLSVYPWFARYYSAGYFSVRKVEQKKQDKKKQELVNAILSEILPEK